MAFRVWGGIYTCAFFPCHLHIAMSQVCLKNNMVNGYILLVDSNLSVTVQDRARLALGV